MQEQETNTTDETPKRSIPELPEDKQQELDRLVNELNSVMPESDPELDSILQEYEDELSGKSDQQPSETPAEASESEPEPSEPENPASEQPSESTNDQKPVPAPTPAPEPTPEPEDEEPDVRQTISDQVSAVMKEKKRRKHRLIHRPPEAPPPEQPAEESVPAASAKKPASGKRGTGESSQKFHKALDSVRFFFTNVGSFIASFSDSDKTDFKYSDDLRSFRGLTPEKALAKAKLALAYYKWRCIAVLILTLISGYISVAPTYSLPLPSFISYIRLPFTYLFLLCAIQIAAMFLCVSLLADGLRMLFRKKFKAEFLIFFACLINLFYTMRIMISPASGGYLPYHTVVIAMLFFGMLTRCLRYSTVIHACQALTVSSGRYMTINGIHASGGSVQTVYKQESVEETVHIPQYFWEEDRIERFMQRYVPSVLILTLILAIIAAAGGSGKAGFLWCWSALLSVSLPGGLLAACVMPMAFVSKRLSGIGTFLNGHKAAAAFDSAESVILPERDLFPAKAVTVSGVRVASDFTPEKVNLCTLAVLKASDCVLYDVLTSSLPRVPLNMPAMENFEFYENGGMGAYVNSDRILVGSYSFLVRSNVKMPDDVENTTGIYVAINMQFAGFYQVRYTAQSSVRRALASLARRRFHPVLAVRDFNLSRRAIEVRFRLPKGLAEYPDLPDRVSLSEPRLGLNDEPLGMMAKNSAFHYADAVVSGKRVHTASLTNTILGIIAAAVGIFLNFFLLFSREASAVTPINELYFSILWFLPALLISAGTNRR